METGKERMLTELADELEVRAEASAKVIIAAAGEFIANRVVHNAVMNRLGGQTDEASDPTGYATDVDDCVIPRLKELFGSIAEELPKQIKRHSEQLEMTETLAVLDATGSGAVKLQSNRHGGVMTIRKIKDDPSKGRRFSVRVVWEAEGEQEDLLDVGIKFIHSMMLSGEWEIYDGSCGYAVNRLYDLEDGHKIIIVTQYGASSWQVIYTEPGPKASEGWKLLDTDDCELSEWIFKAGGIRDEREALPAELRDHLRQTKPVFEVGNIIKCKTGAVIQLDSLVSGPKGEKKGWMTHPALKKEYLKVPSKLEMKNEDQIINFIEINGGFCSNQYLPRRFPWTLVQGLQLWRGETGGWMTLVEKYSPGWWTVKVKWSEDRKEKIYDFSEKDIRENFSIDDGWLNARQE